jgi:hypothetical protein
MIEGRPVVLDYLAALDAGDVTAASMCFATHALYAVPPTPDAGGGRTIVLRGRTEIDAHFARRGRRPFVHNVRSVGYSEGRWWVAGTVTLDPRRVALFASSAILDSDGLIDRYFTVSTTLSAPDAEELLC